MLRLALQKKGRLSEKSIELMRACGIDFSSRSSQLKSKASNFPIEFLFLRDDDIPGYVADGVADLGIVGQNEMTEKNKDVKLVEKLGFSKCRLSLAVPNAKKYHSVKDLENKRIATSYPRILGDFLKEKGVNAEIHEISGSVEIAPTIGLTDAICDIVSTGSTLLSNGLKEVEIIYRSEAVLMANKNISQENQELLDKLMLRIKAVRKAKRYKYILLNIPSNKVKEVEDILPGMKSPTVMPLATEGWSSIHSVVLEDEFWEIVDKLHGIGAEGILVTPIEKMVF